MKKLIPVLCIGLFCTGILSAQVDFFDDFESEDEAYEEEIFIQTESEENEENKEDLFEQPKGTAGFKPLTSVEIEAVEQLKDLVDKACANPNVVSLRNIKAKIQKLEVIYKKDPKLLPLIKILYSLNQLNLQVFDKSRSTDSEKTKSIKGIFEKAKSIFPSSK